VSSSNHGAAPRHEIIEDSAALRSLELAWRALADSVGGTALPQTYEWNLAWWNSFGGSRRLRVHVFFRNDQLVAVIPMFLDRLRYRGLKILQESSNTNGHSPFWEPLVSSDVTDDELRGMVVAVASSSTADIISFLKVPETGRLARLRATKGLGDFPSALRESTKTPLVPIDRRWEDFLGERSQKFRKSLRNKINRWAKDGSREVSRITLRSGDDPALAEMIAVSRGSWKAQAGTDLSSQATSLEFTRQLAALFGARGDASVWFARIDGRPVAYEFHVRHAGTSFPLRADFDESVRELSPGSVTEYTALRNLFEERVVQLYDSCASDYWYLSNWTNEYRSHVDIELFRGTLRASTLRLVEYGLAPVVRRIRRRLSRPETSSKPLFSH
jgi:CelD/BcsL family acetyltransferase involved in cellulose biosynthesis